MNGKYCIVPFGGKVGVLTYENNLGRPMPVFYSATDFRLLFDNKKVTGKIGRGSWWLNHTERRQYEGVVFRPGEPATVDGYLNFWTGWGVSPVKGDWPRMRKHIEDVLASGDLKHADYIMRWAAWMLRNPGSMAEVALVFRGGRGVGKGVFARALCTILGAHGLQISDMHQITGRFNAHLMNCVVMFADEAFWPGDKSAEGTLKRIITEPTLTIEKKRHDTIQVANCLHIIMAANNEWVIPAGLDERRFAVFDASPKYQQKEEYFTPLYAEIAAGGLAAMMHDLIGLDLKGWHPRRGVPQTNALIDQKLRTLSPEDQWWLGLLREGYLPSPARFKSNANPRRAQSAVLFDQARTTVPKLKFASDHVLGGALRDRGCRSVEVERRNGWEFPPLAEARAEWEAKLRAKMNWPRPDATDWSEEPI
jgi:Mesyanzhinovviridae DNA primase